MWVGMQLGRQAGEQVVSRYVCMCSIQASKTKRVNPRFQPSALEPEWDYREGRAQGNLLKTCRATCMQESEL